MDKKEDKFLEEFLSKWIIICINGPRIRRESLWHRQNDIYLDDYSIYNGKDLVEKWKFGQFK